MAKRKAKSQKASAPRRAAALQEGAESAADAPTDRAARLRKLLFFPLLALMITALGANIMLQRLYMEVLNAGSGKVDSFCAINETFNCVTVAASKWSTLANIPVSLYGIEFFSVVVAGLLLSALGLWSLRRWDSLLFIALLIALPVSLTMAAIAVFLVKSVCIMCSLIYGANVLALLIMLVAYRGQLGELTRAGPRELLGLAGPTRAVVVLIFALGVSQFFWVPGVLGTAKGAKGESSGKAAFAVLQGVPQNGMVLGDKSAPILIEEFTDFQCPHCSKAHDVLLKLVRRLKGKVRVRHYDYPLDQACNRKIRQPFHAHACRAAYFARCANEQGKYWPYSALLMHNQHSLGDDDLESYGRRLGLDVNKLRACANKVETRQGVLTDIETGIRRKVRGTPTFFVNGEEVLGPRPLDWWESKIIKIVRGR